MSLKKALETLAQWICIVSQFLIKGWLVLGYFQDVDFIWKA